MGWQAGGRWRGECAVGPRADLHEAGLGVLHFLGHRAPGVALAGRGRPGAENRLHTQQRVDRLRLHVLVHLLLVLFKAQLSQPVAPIALAKVGVQHPKLVPVGALYVILQQAEQLPLADHQRLVALVYVAHLGLRHSDQVATLSQCVVRGEQIAVSPMHVRLERHDQLRHALLHPHPGLLNACLVELLQERSVLHSLRSRHAAKRSQVCQHAGRLCLAQRHEKVGHLRLEAGHVRFSLSHTRAFELRCWAESAPIRIHNI